MRRPRPRNGTLAAHASGVLLALTLAAAAPAAIIPEVGDRSAGALPLESLPAKASALIERPGDQDWYSIFGRPDDQVITVFARVLQGGTCASSQSLRVALFNPEGRWMRSARAGGGDVATLPVPANPSRYTLDVTAPDPACTGLEYELTLVPTERPAPDGAASRCLVARDKRIVAQRRPRVLQRRRAMLSPGAQSRYSRYVSEAQRALSRARRSESKICA